VTVTFPRNMTPAEIEAILIAGRRSIIDDITNLSPEQAHKLLLYLVKHNDPPGFWQHILARNYTKPEFIETLQ